jgi:hypothetical protein
VLKMLHKAAFTFTFFYLHSCHYQQYHQHRSINQLTLTIPWYLFPYPSFHGRAKSGPVVCMSMTPIVHCGSSACVIWCGSHSTPGCHINWQPHQCSHPTKKLRKDMGGHWNVAA